jgi:hypothetical protein
MVGSYDFDLLSEVGGKACVNQQNGAVSYWVGMARTRVCVGVWAGCALTKATAASQQTPPAVVDHDIPEGR